MIDEALEHMKHTGVRSAFTVHDPSHAVDPRAGYGDKLSRRATPARLAVGSEAQALITEARTAS